MKMTKRQFSTEITPTRLKIIQLLQLLRGFEGWAKQVMGFQFFLEEEKAPLDHGDRKSRFRDILFSPPGEIHRPKAMQRGIKSALNKGSDFILIKVDYLCRHQTKDRTMRISTTAYRKNGIVFSSSLVVVESDLYASSIGEEECLEGLDVMVKPNDCGSSPRNSHVE